MKANKKMMILSAFGILMVVDTHAWTTLSVFSNFFPINSYINPLFIFVSGYFIRIDEETKLIPFLITKFKKLMLPIYGFSAVVWLVEQIPFRKGIITYDRITFKDFLIFPWTRGYILSMTVPIWFFSGLFAAVLLYAITRKIFYKFWNDILALFLFVLLGALSVWLSREGYNTEQYLFVLKAAFLVQFLQLGRVYRIYLEEKMDAIPAWIIMTICMCLNAIRQVFLQNGYAVAFNDIMTMSGFTTKYLFLPFVSTVIGLAFFLSMSKVLIPAVGDSKFVNCLSK